MLIQGTVVKILEIVAVHVIVILMMVKESKETMYDVMKQKYPNIDDRCVLHRCQKFNPVCQCDRDCSNYGDCCHDAAGTNPVNNSIHHSMKCMKLSWTGTTYMGNAYQVVSTCPQSWKDVRVRYKCHRLEENSVLENAPVIHSRTNVTYRNLYCAICHGNKKHEVLHWKLDVMCKEAVKVNASSISSLVKTLVNSGQCFVKAKAPVGFSKVNLRLCYVKSPFYVDRCAPGYNGALERSCGAYRSPVAFIYSNSSSQTLFRAYRNIDCLKCDDFQVNKSLSDYLTFYCSFWDLDKFTRYGLRITLNFGSFFYGSSAFDSKFGLACRDDEVFIQRIKRCVRLHCPALSTPQHGDCIKYASSSNYAVLHLSYYVNDSTDAELIRKHVSSFIKPIRCHPSVFPRILGKINVFTGVQTDKPDQCMYVRLSVVISNMFDLKSTSVKCAENNFRNVKVITNLSIIFDDGTLETYCNITEGLPRSNLPLKTIPNYIAEASKSNITCPSIEVYQFEDKNVTISNNLNQTTNFAYYVGNIIVDAGHVNVTSNGFYICWAIFKNYYDTVSESRPFQETLGYKTILSYTGMSLSIVTLTITLLHYIFVPKLLTNHTVILLHLVVLMLVTHSTYILGVKSYPHTSVCWWIGVILHILFLSLFFAMTSTLLQISLQLRSMKNPYSKTKICKMFTTFVLPGYIVTVLIVGTTLAVNRFVFPLEIWYGSDVCYITHPTVLFFSFALPVALCLISNICIFISMVRFFCLLDIPNNTHMETNRGYFWTSVKLSTLTGISWVIGFIEVCTHIEALEVIFEVTSSLQGLFLGFSLLYNDLIRKWYRQRLCKDS